MSSETWVNIPGLVGFYQASDFGNIRSCDRYVNRYKGGKQLLRGRVLKQNRVNKYLCVAVSVKGVPHTKTVHRLVATAFHGRSKLFIDHINRITTDNRPSNLRYVSQRENTSGFNKIPGKLGFIGVSLNSDKYKKRYRARIRINGRLQDLGSYHTAFEASHAYQNKRKMLCQTK